MWQMESPLDLRFRFEGLTREMIATRCYRCLIFWEERRARVEMEDLHEGGRLVTENNIRSTLFSGKHQVSAMSFINYQ